jgi:hypothetical protein
VSDAGRFPTGAFVPFEGFPSSAAVPHRCGRCPRAVRRPPSPRSRGKPWPRSGRDFAPSRSLGISRRAATAPKSCRDPGRPTIGADPGICSRAAADPHPRVRRTEAIRARVAPRAHVRSDLDRSVPPVARRPEPPVVVPPPRPRAPRQRDRSRRHPARPPLPTRARPEGRANRIEAWRPTAGPCSTDESVCTARRCRRPMLVPSMGSVPFRGSRLPRWCARSPGVRSRRRSARSRVTGCPAARHAGRLRLSEEGPTTVAGRWPP